jgi:hypothetical protein
MLHVYVFIEVLVAVLAVVLIGAYIFTPSNKF